MFGWITILVSFHENLPGFSWRVSDACKEEEGQASRDRPLLRLLGSVKVLASSMQMMLKDGLLQDHLLNV